MPQQLSGVIGGTPADINALIRGSVSRDPWWYYSTLKLAAATAFLPQWQLFNASVGQPDPNPLVGGAATQTLTKVETNMPSACSSGFSAPRDLIMDGIGFYFRASGCGNLNDGVGTFCNVSDMLAFTQFTYFEFKIIDKIFAEGMLELKPGGLGFNGMTTAQAQQVFTLGIANPHAVQKSGLQYAKYLAPLQPWSVTIYAPSNAGPQGAAAQLLPQGNSGGHGLWLVSYLSGLTDRAIQ
jgi:hypothetical protein